MLTPISALAAQQSKLTENTMQRTQHFLNYAATQELDVTTYRASDMVLAIHSNVSYLNEEDTRSRAGGHHFLSGGDKSAWNSWAQWSVYRPQKVARPPPIAPTTSSTTDFTCISLTKNQHGQHPNHGRRRHYSHRCPIPSHPEERNNRLSPYSGHLRVFNQSSATPITACDRPSLRMSGSPIDASYQSNSSVSRVQC
eukprot:scaffold8446_cov38-Cyclotella_meneghiniana.AAC.2